MIDYYDMEGEPITMQQWVKMLKDYPARRIAHDQIGDIEVSTVWLGIDHNFLTDGPPLIFETMIFGGDYEEDCWRYPTREAALAGHDQAVALVRETQLKKYNSELGG